MLRRGYITDLDDQRARVKVRLAGHDEHVTSWLAVGHRWTLATREFTMPALGEHVAVLMDDQDEFGVVLCGIYTDPDVRPEDSRGVAWAKEFQDGTLIQYDPIAHKLTLETLGQVTLEALGKVRLSSATALSLEASGPVSIQAHDTCDVAASGPLTLKASDVVTVKGYLVNVVSDTVCNLTAGQAINLAAPTITLTGAAAVSLNAPAITATGAATITMVAPMITLN